MRLFAYILLAATLASVFCIPLLEVVFVYTDRIAVNAAVTNSCRSAKTLSIVYDYHRDLDAVVDTDYFKEYFIDTFEVALGLDCVDESGSGTHFELGFRSNNDHYNDFIIDMDFDEQDSGLYDGSTNTIVTIGVDSKYKFKSGLLSDAVSNGEKYRLMSTKKFNLNIQN